MKSRIVAIVGVGLGIAIMSLSAVGQDPTKGAATKGASHPAMKDQKTKASYSFGLVTGRGLKSQGVDLDIELVLMGLNDGLAGAKSPMTDQEMQAALTALQREVQARMSEASLKAADKNKKEGEAFLAENKKKPGVVTTKSGLQYKVMKEGNGATPKTTDTVTTHYRGTLLDGTEFDSSYKRNAPASFPVNGVIKGWTEALQLMKVGSKCQLFIPSELAYGAQGNQAIGPNSTLIFDIELLDVK